MLAVDTNIVVRIVTVDDRRQAARARSLVENNAVFVATTVMLETEWVLRSVYGFKPTEIATKLGAFAGLPHVTVENASRVAKALDWMKGGVDFADALHLAASDDCDAFVTFDEGLLRSAKAIAGVRVRLP